MMCASLGRFALRVTFAEDIRPIDKDTNQRCMVAYSKSETRPSFNGYEPFMQLQFDKEVLGLGACTGEFLFP